MSQSQIIFWRSDDAKNRPIEASLQCFFTVRLLQFSRGGECDDNYGLGVELWQRLLGL